jgi:hypothetical protein
MMDYPLVLFAVSLLVLWFSERAGAYLRRRQHNPDEIEREDLGVILGAALTLLALIIGFSFSMAVTRYDQRKNYEEEEANAIGTEYVRAGLLPAAHALKVRELLRDYVNQRVLFYTTRSARRLDEINASTAHLQSGLWSAVQASAAAQPTPVVGLAVSGMNDVLNSQGYTQAAWWNRIPSGAWALMGVIAICCNLLLGYTSRRSDGKTRQFVILPMIVSIAFFLIADLDAPRGGVIRVSPQNLITLSADLQAP